MLIIFMETSMMVWSCSKYMRSSNLVLLIGNELQGREKTFQFSFLDNFSNLELSFFRKFSKINAKRSIEVLQNCNYAVELGKKLSFILVGIEGNDIMTGNKTLTLGLGKKGKIFLNRGLESENRQKFRPNTLATWSNLFFNPFMHI